MGGQIVETTGNRQMELAFDTFCVGERSLFLCPPHRRCPMPAPFDGTPPFVDILIKNCGLVISFGPRHFFIFSKDGIHVGARIDLISQRDIPLNTEYYILWSPKTEVSSHCTDEIRHSSLYCRTNLV
jgi:hypothetical protein